jgi:hypothetical protein
MRLEKYEIAVLLLICRTEEVIEAGLEDFRGRRVAAMWPPSSPAA